MWDLHWIWKCGVTCGIELVLDESLELIAGDRWTLKRGFIDKYVPDCILHCLHSVELNTVCLP